MLQPACDHGVHWHCKTDGNALVHSATEPNKMWEVKLGFSRWAACNCPHAVRGNFCKHQALVILVGTGMSDSAVLQAYGMKLSVLRGVKDGAMGSHMMHELEGHDAFDAMAHADKIMQWNPDVKLDESEADAVHDGVMVPARTRCLEQQAAIRDACDGLDVARGDVATHEVACGFDAGTSGVANGATAYGEDPIVSKVLCLIKQHVEHMSLIAVPAQQSHSYQAESCLGTDVALLGLDAALGELGCPSPTGTGSVGNDAVVTAGDVRGAAVPCLDPTHDALVAASASTTGTDASVKQSVAESKRLIRLLQGHIKRVESAQPTATADQPEERERQWQCIRDRASSVALALRTAWKLEQ
jgi:hypothetical protein